MKIIFRDWVHDDGDLLPSYKTSDWSIWTDPTSIIDFIKDSNTDLDRL